MKKHFAIFLIVMFLTALVIEEAYARAGGGGRSSGGGSRSSASSSSGSRGSRTYSAPKTSQQNTQAVQAQRPVAAAPAPAYATPQRSGFFSSSFGRGLAGGLIGGALGSMLFGSHGYGGGYGGGGYGGGYGGGGGIGLFDIILLLIIGYIIYRVIKSRRRNVHDYETTYMVGNSYESSYEEPHSEKEIMDSVTGLRDIKQIDHNFDEYHFIEAVSSFFIKLQDAWSKRNLEPVKSMMMPEIYVTFNSDVEKMKANGEINKIENISLKQVIITEAWQEKGKDYITVEISANLIDYTTDESGKLIDGDNVNPDRFTEFWTFVRNSNTNDWKFTAIQQQ
ncbi:Tim44 domain-containing protein [Candidatus Magnetomonas plexicatena]|uniref:Tim44 domain-containing protein n=1 Tax=Candidatus Magnetomonas plexicatena TaxID=2552947 RepID=UPI0011037F49|nr:Tim44 domain-containing protein [Nitrospirales bacterium LBB_01]